LRTKAVLLIFVGAFAIAASNVDVKPRPLQVSGTRVLDVPVFPWFGLPHTDQDGDLFFHVGGTTFNDATIVKLSHSSMEPTLYKLPGDVKKKYNFDEFAVTPGGGLWMLANSMVPELLAIEFNGSGEVRTKTTLDLALDEVDIHGFAALDSGSLVIAGAYTNKAVSKLRGHSFLVLLDSNTGKKIRELLDTIPAVDGSKGQSLAHEGETVTGDDGNIYLLHESLVVVVGPGGGIIRRISFKKPSAGLQAMQIRVSSGAAAIWLGKEDSETHRAELSFLVLDLSNGKPIGWYAAPSDLNGQAVGFSRSTGLQFFQRKQGHFEIVTTELR
jgi:hypothetical protein